MFIYWNNLWVTFCVRFKIYLCTIRSAKVPSIFKSIVTIRELEPCCILMKLKINSSLPMIPASCLCQIELWLSKTELTGRQMVCVWIYNWAHQNWKSVGFYQPVALWCYCSLWFPSQRLYCFKETEPHTHISTMMGWWVTFVLLNEKKNSFCFRDTT